MESKDPALFLGNSPPKLSIDNVPSPMEQKQHDLVEPSGRLVCNKRKSGVKMISLDMRDSDITIAGI